MSTTYTVSSADVILCDINSTLSSTTLTIPTYSTYTGGLAFNFSPGATVTRQSNKSTYVIQKPGVPVGYEIGMGERLINITTTIKASTSTYASGIFHSLTDLRYLAHNQYDKQATVGSTRASYGVVQLYYSADGISTALIPVMFKSLWVEQVSGKGSMFDIRVQLSEVVSP